MTLLLSLVTPSGIHMSSDFRLTDITAHVPIEDAFGSKQLQFNFDKWNAHLSFTGIAKINGRGTLDWISQALEHMPRNSEVTKVMDNLAAVATSEFKNIPKALRELTMVLAVVQATHPGRLFAISCNQQPDGPPLAEPLDKFEVYAFSTDNPRALQFGYTGAVSEADRKFMKKLSMGKLSPEEIRSALARINARSAKESNEFISPGCLVTTILPGGDVASENFGRTPGLPSHMVPPEMAKLITQRHGKKALYLQSREAHAKNATQVTLAPMNVTKGSTLVMRSRQQGDGTQLFTTDSMGNTWISMPTSVTPDSQTADAEEAQFESQFKSTKIEENRTFLLSSTTNSATIYAPNNEKAATITIGGAAETVSIKKNKFEKVILNTITAQLHPPIQYNGPAISRSVTIPAKPIIDGIQPRSWDYVIDVIFNGSYSFSVRRMAVALRSANYPSPLPLLHQLEELVMSVPRIRTVLTVSLDTPTASANIEARFLLRDFPK
jgi:hypothetical protein